MLSDSDDAGTFPDVELVSLAVDCAFSFEKKFPISCVFDDLRMTENFRDCHQIFLMLVSKYFLVDSCFVTEKMEISTNPNKTILSGVC